MSAHKPGVLHRPSGPLWDARCRNLRAMWWRQRRPCYYCSHGFAAPGLIEVGHIISWSLRWDLREDLGNLVPAHGGGIRRCPEPGCDLACNQVANNVLDAPRNPETRASLPFGEQFLARQAELRRRFLARTGGQAAPVRPPEPPAPGREW